MKFKKPNSKTVQEHAALAGGAVLGGVASNGIFDAVHKPKGVDPAKDKNTGLLIRGGMAAVSGYVGAGITGTDFLSTAAKGLLLGVAATQAVELVKTMTADSASLQKDNVVAKFVRAGLNGGCGCSQNSLGRGRSRRRSRLAMPVAEYTPVYQMQEQYNANPLDQAMQTGAMLSA